MSDDKPNSVKLLNVPHFRQGDFDGLCTYYTGAMMLATLHPKYAVEFGKPRGERTTKRMSNDPIFRNYSKEDHRLVLARWFYRGEWIDKMVEVLNAVMHESSEIRSEFICVGGNKSSDSTLHRIIAKVNDGLPVMLGWDAEDYGCHAVLVTGYWKGEEMWLYTNDPGGGDGQISWNSLRAQQRRRFEVGLCERHDGLRPMKRTTMAEGEPPVIHQWNTRDGKYEEIA